MFNMRKKGIADVVAVMLIILLSVVSISLMWSYVSRVTSSLSPEFSCFYAQANQIYELDSACIDNSDPPQAKVVVSRSIQDETITEILSIALTKTSGNPLIYSCGSGTFCNSAAPPDPGTNQEFILDIDEELALLNYQAHLSINGCPLDDIAIEQTC